eukprot:TRINITY_DN467_c0_g1_i2.p1 TRINITY_DN467_c0_g1~~TRINITY_DN467_c0_g1_i2.p1  ORF type:complete len:129 (+),score=28.16 TRINITY_DN467_c0_g1_i2:205-591(+)
MQENGVNVVAICSETQAEADEARSEWECQMPIIGDQQNEYAHWMIKEGYLPKLAIIHDTGKKDPKRLGNPEWYPTGCVQPGVLFVRPSAKETLYSWSVVPSPDNYNGAIGRPDVPALWETIKDKVKAK